MSADDPDRRTASWPRDADEIVDDPEEYNQKRRLKEIHDARRNFHKQRQKAQEAKVEGELSYRAYTRILLQAYQRLFYELEGVMRRHDRGEHYLHEVELGDIHPVNKSDPLEFVGLLSLAGNVPCVEVMGQSMDEKRGQTKDRQILTHASEEIITRGFRECSKFLAESGLDADLTDAGQENGEFEYDDLV